MDSVFFVFEMIGVVAFALSGAMWAIRNEMDVLGVCVLGATTAVGGGILRDLLLGITPPAALRNPLMLMIAACVSVLTFSAEYLFGDKTAGEELVRQRTRHEQLFNAIDALSLSMFVIVGIDAAVDAGYGNNAFLTIFVGCITGVGGGVLRDVMIRRIPIILQKRIYALAAMLGAALDVALIRLGCADTVSAIIAVCFIILIRILSARFRWNLPRYPKY